MTYYATFWQRLKANLVDFVVIGFVIPLSVFADGTSRELAIASIPALSTVQLAYDICLHALFGQTVGKRLVGIRVVRIDGSRIGWKEAFLRYSVNVMFAVLSVFGYVLVYLRLPDAHFALPWMQRSVEFTKAMPSWLVWEGRAVQVWAWSELFVMLYNARRRALHDFIAGTIVVYEVPETVAGHQGSSN